MQHSLAGYMLGPKCSLEVPCERKLHEINLGKFWLTKESYVAYTLAVDMKWKKSFKVIGNLSSTINVVLIIKCEKYVES